VFRRGGGVGEGGRRGERGGSVEGFGPLLEFVGEGELLFDVGEGGEQDLAEVGECGGFAEGDAVLCGGDEEFAEDVVDVGGGEKIALEGCGDLGAQALGLEELELFAGVEDAEAGMGGGAEHAAGAAVGELEFAAWGDSGAGICVGHVILSEMDLSCFAKDQERRVLRVRLLKTARKSRFLASLGMTAMG
jgi:hypothetical protein